ncbi:MAG: long-chain fatty acid--CoA ligase, partial [Microbacterium gubbeenense]
MIEVTAEPLVPSDPSRNISDLLADRARETPDKPICGLAVGDGWRDKTARDVESEVIALASGFIASG